MSDPLERPLTRRELRERERMELSPLELAEAAVAADEATDTPVEIRTDEILTESVVPLSPDAERLIAAGLHEPDLFLAAPAATPDADDVKQSQAAVSAVTTSTEIPFPTRARRRAEESDPSSTRPRRASARERLAPSVRPKTAAAAPTSPRTTSAAPTGRMRKVAATSMSMVAMAFVALMAVSTSLPAEALLSSADVQAAAQVAQQSTRNEPAQTLAMDGGADTISVERDGYQSKTVAEVAAASGIRMEATFTNNPNGTVQWPFSVGVHIGDQFGFRDCAGCSSNHGGQDFNPGLGAPIQSIADGVVRFAEDGEGSLGVHMIIDHMIDGKLVSSVYAHMVHDSMLFKAGDVVTVGQVIGQVGNTGMSTGPHLHFEIRVGGMSGTKVDPLVWLYANTN
ncbi:MULTISPECIES: M23 family metallopeptidase [Cryobacterium]|uniref:M23 family metallopeptidase n=1 Tax=Cryobacterium breve TaxID=1259258 RepID=A0ABY2IZE1_9MICO|nr:MULTISPECIES: M23 family metallopeptidase [Cryobacterium]TFC96026.1 M23 family metallopeptidase [Cryobacterium sp. TmT3-12]TFC97998.1 M23 family metallopeptidase [Cryobacterium breve]